MVDDFVQAAIEVDEGARSPQPAGEGLAGDELARLLEQRQQQLERLIAEGRSTAVSGEFARASVDGEDAETVDTRGLDAISHRAAPAGSFGVYHRARAEFSPRGVADARDHLSRGLMSWTCG